MTTRRWFAGVGAMLAAAALVLGGCSSDESTKTTAAVTTTTQAATESADLCAIFNQLAASGAGPDAQNEATTPEGWETRIATTAKIVEAAPADWRDEAETYLQMVKDRAQLAADNGYVGVNDLPADVRTAFISSHAAAQADVNKLIAYMKSECASSTSG